MDLNKTEEIVDKVVPDKLKSYLIAILLFSNIGLAYLMYNKFIKPEAKIDNNNDLLFINNDLSKTKDSLNELKLQFEIYKAVHK